MVKVWQLTFDSLIYSFLVALPLFFILPFTFLVVHLYIKYYKTEKLSYQKKIGMILVHEVIFVFSLIGYALIGSTFLNDFLKSQNATVVFAIGAYVISFVATLLLGNPISNFFLKLPKELSVHLSRVISLTILSIFFGIALLFSIISLIL